MKFLRSIVLFLLCLFVSVASFADEELQIDKDGQPIIDAGNRTIDYIGTVIFEPFLTQEQKAFFKNGRILVEPYSDFNAFTRYETSEIIVPALLVAEVQQQVQAMLLVANNHALDYDYKRWLKYLVERSLAVRNRVLSGKVLVDDVPIESFWHFARLPKPARLTDREGYVQEQMMIDTLAFVVGHELGHIALHHKPYREISSAQSFTQEFAADQYALTLMKRAKRSVLGVISTMYVRFALTQYLGDGGKLQSTQTHPSPECRIYKIGSEEMREQMRDESSRQRYESASGMSIASLGAMLEDFRESCGDL